MTGRRGAQRRVFTPEESAEILRLTRLEANDSVIARQMGCGHQTIRNHLISLKFGKRGRPPPVGIPCMRCRKPFKSRDPKRNRLCESCVYYAAEQARSAMA